MNEQGGFTWKNEKTNTEAEKSREARDRETETPESHLAPDLSPFLRVSGTHAPRFHVRLLPILSLYNFPFYMSASLSS